MDSSIWLASALGLGGGVALSYAVAKAVLPRLVSGTPDTLLVVRLAFAGTVVALLPAFLLSFVVGGTLGSAWGERLFSQIGPPSSGAPLGLAAGIALVFAAVLLSGAGAGALLGKLVLRYRQWRTRAES